MQPELEGALLLLGGAVLGRISARPTRRKTSQYGKPVCTCGHGAHDHSKEKGCHAKVYDGWFDRALGDTSVCTCRKYVGPDPADYYPGGGL
jgi:ferredoxin-thioredoxin reductase catalytic subunit